MNILIIKSTHYEKCFRDNFCSEYTYIPTNNIAAEVHLAGKFLLEEHKMN
jgi:hypothetical protein